MKKLSALFLALSLSLCVTSQNSVTRLIGASPWQDSYWILDTSNFNTVTTGTFSALNGSVVTGCTGMARHPVSGVIYTVIKAGIGRNLCTFNPATGSLTLVGDLGDMFSQISFTGNSSLWGITGLNGPQPQSIFRINPATASNTLLAGPMNGSYGQLIRYNTTDNKLYHWAGNGSDFEKLDTAALNTPTAVGYNPPNVVGELAGAVYRSNNVFIICDLNGSLYKMNTSGAYVSAGSAPDALKGMSFISCTRSITPSASTLCPGGTVTLTMNGGGINYQWYRNGVAISGATNQAVSTTSIGLYKCMISDNCGTDSVAGVQIVPQNPTVTITGSNYFCTGITSITLTGTAGGTSQWYKNGVSVPGATLNVYTATTTGVYNMIKTNLNGCFDSSAVSKVLNNANSPTVNVTAGSTTLCVGSTVSMQATGANTYSWSQGANTASVIVAPTVTTTYSVTGSNSLTGCFNTATITIAVSSCVGLKELDAGTEIRIYPNPTEGQLHFESSKTLTSLEVFDLSGRSVFIMTQIGSEKFDLNLSGLENSVYFIKLHRSDGSEVQVKAVIQR